MLPKDKGTYLFLLCNSCNQEISAGKFGKYHFTPGYYLYVGSAFGPGGLNARIDRHFRQEKKLRWHIDFLSTTMKPVECWFHASSDKLECRWNSLLESLHDDYPLRGFGSSDCKCPSHLHYFRKKPSRAIISASLDTPLKTTRG